jgi:carboxymethylenebutenolidase
LSATTARGRFRPGARPSSAILGHFAEIDDFEPSEWVTEVETALRQAGADVEFHRYPGARHWFAGPDRPEYDPAAAEAAWARTGFLHGAG